MNETAVKALMAEIAPVIRDYVDGAADQMAKAFTAAVENVGKQTRELVEENNTLKARIATLEEKTAQPVEIDAQAAENLFQQLLAKHLPEPASVDPEQLKTFVDEAVAALPPAEPGAPGKDGESVDTVEVREFILTELSRAAAELPKPKDGADGRGIKDLIIDRNGHLVATMNDGEMKDLGPVVGKDGEPGRDGFTLEDFDCEVVDERTINLKFVRGDTCHSYELVFPVPVYQGVFKEGVTYSAGDICTWGGSAWSAKRETSDKPDMPDSGWVLAVKRGRDGKDFKPKEG